MSAALLCGRQASTGVNLYGPRGGPDESTESKILSERALRTVTDRASGELYADSETRKWAWVFTRYARAF